MAAAEGRGHFFIVDARVWARVTSVGMNAAVAYLVLACGTDFENKKTNWSTEAIMNYGGVGWDRAKAAIAELVVKGIVSFAENHTASRPRYELATYGELLDREAAKNPQRPLLNSYEQKLIDNLQRGIQPANKPARARAQSLYQRGVLRRDREGAYSSIKAAVEDAGSHSIWLPKSIVMETPNGENSPLRRLRSAGCVWTLRLYVDLYAVQNLRDDGGISPRLLWRLFERKQIGEQGPYTVWGFKEGKSKLWPSGPFSVHAKRLNTNTESTSSPSWQSLHLLMQMGLLAFVPHIFENDTDSAETVHPFGIGESAEDPLEQQIGTAADSAARAMALPSKLQEAEDSGFRYFCPVPRTMPGAQMIGIARLTYRPHTRRTSIWSANLHRDGPRWIEKFLNLAAKAEKAGVIRAANYA